jgi:hypothetical protein
VLSCEGLRQGSHLHGRGKVQMSLINQGRCVKRVAGDHKYHEEARGQEEPTQRQTKPTINSQRLSKQGLNITRQGGSRPRSTQRGHQVELHRHEERRRAQTDSRVIVQRRFLPTRTNVSPFAHPSISIDLCEQVQPAISHHYPAKTQENHQRIQRVRRSHPGGMAWLLKAEV